jgi:pimeloyl-ACP methyl ester carboxylesterase
MPAHTTSADGTTIAYESHGQGPPLVLVFGALSDRNARFATPAHLLDHHFTVFTYDRRGRGASRDAPTYSVQNEIDDLAAVIETAIAETAVAETAVIEVAEATAAEATAAEATAAEATAAEATAAETAVAETAGGKAHVFGHSSGAILALKAARAGLPIDRLAVYEPPFILDGTRPRPPGDLAHRLRDLINQGRRADALRLNFTEAMQFPPETVTGIERGPLWAHFLSLAHTLPYDMEICGPGNHLPVADVAQIGVPTLVIAGEKSPAWMRASTAELAKTIPGARHVTLEGQDHGTRPAVLAPVLRDFYLMR